LILFAPATPQNSTDSLDDKSHATLEDVGPLIVRSVTLEPAKHENVVTQT
jgi:hypothetical protein